MDMRIFLKCPPSDTPRSALDSSSTISWSRSCGKEGYRLARFLAGRRKLVSTMTLFFIQEFGDEVSSVLTARLPARSNIGLDRPDRRLHFLKNSCLFQSCP